MRVNKHFVASALLAGLAFTVSGQDAKKGDVANDSKKPAKPITAIIGADIYTVTKGVIRGGTVLVQDGKILKVGQDVAIPEGATKIDATGKVIAPGFVAVSAQNIALRAAGGGPGGGQGGGGQGGQTRLADSLNPFDRNIQICLGTGITTVCVEMGGAGGGRFGRDSDANAELSEEDVEFITNLLEQEDGTRVCPCCGMSILPTQPITPPAPTDRVARRAAVLKLSFGEMTGMIVKETPFYHVPAGSFVGALNRHNWRDTIKRAKQQVKQQETAAAAAEAGVEAPAGGGGGANRRVPPEIIQLVEKKIPLRTEAYSAEQMRDMVALAKELDYNLILDGVHEAWMMAGDLSSAKVQAVLTPRSRRRAQPGKEDSSGSSIETSSSLEKAGVPFAVSPLSTSVSLDGIPGRDLTSLPIEAMFAVRGGCSEQTALESLTIVPARMLGLADRIGSIEEGKDADLLILDGPPLDYRTNVQQAYVGGKMFYDRQREKIFPERLPVKK